MCAPSPPAPPDFAGAARAQGQANLGATYASDILGNPNVISPFGSQTVLGSPGETQAFRNLPQAWQTAGNWPAGTTPPTTGGGLLPSGPTSPVAKIDGTPIYRPTVIQQLSPEQQRIYNAQTALSQGLLGTAQTQLRRADLAMNAPFPTDLTQVQDLDLSGLPQTQALTAQGLPNIPDVNLAALPESGRLTAQGLPGATLPDPSRLPGVTTPDASRLPGFNPLTAQGLPGVTGLNLQGLSGFQQLGTEGLGALGDVNLASLTGRTVSPTVGGLRDISSAITGLYEPDISERERRRLDDLTIQGQSVTGPAREAEERAFADERNRLRMAALLQAGGEQSRLFGMESAQRGQELNEQLAALGVGAQNRAQLFGERGMMTGAAAAQRAQELGEQQALFNTQAGLRSQLFGERGAEAADAAARRAQLFGEQQGTFGAEAALRNQLFGEQQGLFGAQSALRGQLFGERAGILGAEEAQRAQRLSELLAAQQAGAGTRAQLFGERGAVTGAGEAQRLARLQEAQAQLAADTAQRQRQIQEAAYLRQLPLTEISALRSGSQPTLPQFQGYASQPVAPAPIFAGAQAQGQAQQDLYAQQIAQRNALMQGLFGLGSAGIMAYPF